MNTRNSTNVVWIDTHRVTLCEMEADVSYHAEDLRQGRDAQNRVPAFSMLAGVPARTAIDVARHNARARALRWILAVDALAFAAMGLLIYFY